MSIYKRINPSSKLNNDTGFASIAEEVGGRFINKDGTYNIAKEGMSFWKRFSVFNSMLNFPRWKFIIVILLFYFCINLVFTSIYYLMGPSQFEGLKPGSNWKIFREIYYFSMQTYTTVGYGHVSPVGDAVSILSGFESLTGLLSLAIATGLLYGRFSKPRCYLVFSDHAVVGPYKDITGLIFRFAAFKDKHTLTDVEIKVNVGMLVLENEKPQYKYFSLALERNKVESMALSWNVVHPIDEASPFYGLSEDDFKHADVELYVGLRGYDDVFSNFVLLRTSYTYNEIFFNRKFVQMYRESDDGKTTILELHKLNEHKEVARQF